MSHRRHHNNDARTSIKRGRTREWAEALAARMGIRYGGSKGSLSLRLEALESEPEGVNRMTEDYNDALRRAQEREFNACRSCGQQLILNRLHEPSQCLMHLRGLVTALTLRVEALEQSELAGVLPDLPVGLSAGRLRPPLKCRCVVRWQLAGNHPKPGSIIPHDAYCEEGHGSVRNLDAAQPD